MATAPKSKLNFKRILRDGAILTPVLLLLGANVALANGVACAPTAPNSGPLGINVVVPSCQVAQFFGPFTSFYTTMANFMVLFILLAFAFTGARHLMSAMRLGMGPAGSDNTDSTKAMTDALKGFASSGVLTLVMILALSQGVNLMVDVFSGFSDLTPANTQTVPVPTHTVPLSTPNAPAGSAGPTAVPSGAQNGGGWSN